MTIFAKLIYLIISIIETFISIRILFILLNANSQNSLVKFVFDLSDIFISPFLGITSYHIIKIIGLNIDFVALISLIIYMIIAYGVMEMIRVFDSKK